MKYQTILISENDNVTTITINRPDKLNALSVQVLTELKNFLENFSKMSDALPCGLIVTGSGERAFVAGADIKGMSEMNAEEGMIFGELGQEVTVLLESLPCPVVACVDGFALGGGCELAMGCDFIYATKNAVFGQPEVNLGLIPGFGGCVRLMRYVGPAMARELIFSGRSLSAEEGRDLGLVNRVFETKDEMLHQAEATLRVIMTKSPKAVAICKKVINASIGNSIKRGLEIEAKGFGEAFVHPQKKEGVTAFLQKKSPRFFIDVPTQH
jgi:enoyl-CoA hydratase